jgi:hypothetical protein
MLGEQVARQAGEALVADVCARAKHNGNNIMDQPTDKLVGYVKVRCVTGNLGTCTSNIVACSEW